MTGGMGTARRSGTLAAALGCLLAASAARAAGETQDEPLITAPGVEGDYLRVLHQQLHWRWAKKFVADELGRRPAADPINNPALEVELLFTVRWDGSPAEITVAHSSGNAEFDAAAVNVVRGDVPMPFTVPPLDLFGDDGVTHFRWVFARDNRLCSGG